MGLQGIFGQASCLIDHGAEQFRGEAFRFPKERSGGPPKSSSSAAFPGKSVGRHRRERVALNRAYKSQRLPCFSGVFDDAHTAEGCRALRRPRSWQSMRSLYEPVGFVIFEFDTTRAISRVQAFAVSRGSIADGSNTEFRRDKGFVRDWLCCHGVSPLFFDSHTSARMATLYAWCEAGLFLREKARALAGLAGQTKV